MFDEIFGSVFVEGFLGPKLVRRLRNGGWIEGSVGADGGLLGKRGYMNRHAVDVSCDC